MHASDTIPEINGPAVHDRIVLVFGATGQQGGAVAHALVNAGWKVRALVRDPSSSGAQALAATGVDVRAGDLADEESIERAMEGAYGVFSVQPSSGQGAAYNVSDEDEIRYGCAIADLAVASGVQHLVYTSVNAAGEQQTGMGHFDSKSKIEAHIRGLRLKATIIRPAGFMELLMLPGMGLDKGHYVSFVRPEQAAQLIAVQDIGKIVAGIFAAPDRYAGKTFEIAGDTITGHSLQQSLSAAIGHPIHYSRFPNALLQENVFLGRLAELFDDGRLSGHADIQALQAEFGALTSFDAWLQGAGKPLLEAALQAGDAPIALR
ncbi:Uncharacterized conserved protein YbjT, contains NAD(P)-binding and DUF2867 domains [Pseudoxanthomonas sp. GM95]|uniref:NmrA/HSCARG family protein n=1 Tax=Pseudoxanthomonas sp. GM95 TaxID=1881043 RepID=UPI0008B3D85D|nr:NmrA/HSCARG family protein [Pseudoxanthomonas sp. GM95]SEM08715.1 Uncharacterized conserved protein YbjT, contains NAD(P)-binding and DUF2867 domains [Pseudoxanthomonas sp. GM95]